MSGRQFRGDRVAGRVNEQSSRTQRSHYRGVFRRDFRHRTEVFDIGLVERGQQTHFWRGDLGQGGDLAAGVGGHFQDGESVLAAQFAECQGKSGQTVEVFRVAKGQSLSGKELLGEFAHRRLADRSANRNHCRIEPFNGPPPVIAQRTARILDQDVSAIDLRIALADD